MVRLKGMTPTTLLKAAYAGIRCRALPKHLFIGVADHFEPDWKNAPPAIADERVRRWRIEYGSAMGGFEDSRGRPPQHTFFYPAEVYEPNYIDSLAELAREGWGDVEVHLHHDNDSGDRLHQFLNEYVARLNDVHGLLSRDANDQVRYGFVHGNWALDNSRPDGAWCGVNNELSILMETGCYADLTMPSAPDECQVRTINQIYYATDDPDRPCSHDQGVPARCGAVPAPNQLLMIQGPLCLRRLDLGHRRGWTIENGNLTATQLPTMERLNAWVRCGVGVKDRPDWRFVKLHTHGAQEDNADILLGEPMRRFHAELKEFATRFDIKYYYVTAREMAQLIHQIECNAEQPDFDRLGW